MNVTWLVSPNGLGHATRATELAASLVDLRPGVNVSFAMERWQRERLASTPALLALGAAGARFHDGLVARAPRWPVADASLDLLAWRDDVARAGVIDGADLVVSDNLAGVLALAPGAVLCGSFLWSDVLAPLAGRSPQVARFVADERGLLAAHRPLMLCNADLAMPGVLAQTRAAPLAWMGERTAPMARGQTVALLGGASGAADEGLIALARALAARGVELALSADLARRPDAPAVRAFDHSIEAYAGARLLICRPGVGTLTRAIATGRPILVSPEPDHPEMAHNATKLEALGLARRLPAPEDVTGCAETVCALLADETALAAMTAASLARPHGGRHAAVSLLLVELERAASELKEASA